MDILEDLFDEDFGRVIASLGIGVCSVVFALHICSVIIELVYAIGMTVGVGLICFGLSMFLSTSIHDRKYYTGQFDSCWKYAVAILCATMVGSTAAWIVCSGEVSALTPVYKGVAILSCIVLLIGIVNAICGKIEDAFTKEVKDAYYNRVLDKED